MSAQTSPVARRDSRADTNVVVWASISAAGVLLAGAVLLIALSLLSWATDQPVGSTAGSATQVALQAWYLAHSVSLPVSWGALSVPPLLITGFIALLFYRSGRGAARACSLRTPAQVAEALAAIVITYVTCALLLSSIARPSDPMLSIWDIVIGTGTLALVASLAGLLRESGLGARLIALLPGPSYAYARGALAACWALAGMSAVAVGLSLIIGYSETSALTAALAPNGLGGVTIIGISIAFLPNAMLLATALGTGAGFNLGDGSLYSLGTVDREALPIFPLFAALPHEAGGFVLLSVLVPLVAAIVGALTMTRHLEPEHRTATNLLTGSAMCGVLTAVGILGVALYAAGGLGDGRLSAVGASAWRVSGFLAVEMVVAVAITAFIATRRSLKPLSVARREKALSVLETGESSSDSAESDRSPDTADTADAAGAKGGDSTKKSKGSTTSKTTSKTTEATADSKGAAESKGAVGSKRATKSKGAVGSKASAESKGTGGSTGPAGPGAVVGDESAEVGDAAATTEGSEVAELEPDSSTRPVIVSKLAMRRLARGGKRTAKAQSAAAIKKQPTAAPKTAPTASLSVVKRARTAKAQNSSAKDQNSTAKARNSTAKDQNSTAKAQNSSAKADAASAQRRALGDPGAKDSDPGAKDSDPS